MNNPVTLVHITDLHFFSQRVTISHFFSKRLLGYVNWVVNRSRRFDFTFADKFLARVRERKPRAVIISGDFTVTSDLREFEIAKEFVDDIKSIGVSVYLIPGNHDYYTFESVRNRQFERFFGEYLVSGGYPAGVKLEGNLSMIFLHTVMPNFFSSRGVISREQLEKLAGIVKNSNLPVIVCAHYPVLHRTETYYSNVTRRLGNASLLRQVLIGSRVPLLYIAGHVHHYSYTVDRDNSLVAYLTTPPLFYKREYNGGYCEISFDGEKFGVKLVPSSE